MVKMKITIKNVYTEAVDVYKSGRELVDALEEYYDDEEVERILANEEQEFEVRWKL